MAVLKYFSRMQTLKDHSYTKQVFHELHRLHDLGFNTWYSDVLVLYDKYALTTDIGYDEFIKSSKRIVTANYKSWWVTEIKNAQKHPILRFYNTFKCEFYRESYLHLVNDYKYRNAIARIRCSSHPLAIERGRHTRPITPTEQRLCNFCHEIDDEYHFIFYCKINAIERKALFDKIITNIYDINELTCYEQLQFLLNHDDPQCLTWFGKFLYKSLIGRDAYIISAFIPKSQSILNYMVLRTYMYI